MPQDVFILHYKRCNRTTQKPKGKAKGKEKTKAENTRKNGACLYEPPCGSYWCRYKAFLFILFAAATALFSLSLFLLLQLTFIPDYCDCCRSFPFI